MTNYRCECEWLPAGEYCSEPVYVEVSALLVLMATLENATHPKALANTVKHLAFNRCSDRNLYGMVDAQIPVIESELFAEQI